MAPFKLSFLTLVVLSAQTALARPYSIADHVEIGHAAPVWMTASGDGPPAGIAIGGVYHGGRAGQDDENSGIDDDGGDYSHNEATTTTTEHSTGHVTVTVPPVSGPSQCKPGDDNNHDNNNHDINNNQDINSHDNSNHDNDGDGNDEPTITTTTKYSTDHVTVTVPPKSTTDSLGTPPDGPNDFDNPDEDTTPGAPSPIIITLSDRGANFVPVETGRPTNTDFQH